MKVFHNIVQGTEEWHEIKYRKIGGSTSKGLFVKSDTLLIDLLSEFLEPFQLEDEGFVNSAMQRGIELEPNNRAEVEKYAGVKFIVPGWMESELVPLIGISPDGITEDLTVSFEGKCPSKTKHTSTILANEIPADNIHQCLHYFTVNDKLQRHYFSSYRPESDRPLWVKMLTPESIIDLGTKAKPLPKPISEWVQIARGEAMKLDADIKAAIEKLSF